MSGIDYKAEYDEYWSRLDRWGSSSFPDVEELATNVLKTCGGGSVLDVGCGMGSLVHELLSQGINARAVDISRRCVEEGNRRSPGRFVLGSMLELPFEDASFDTLVCTDVLEHLTQEDADRAIDEMARVARRNLFICVSTAEDRDKRWHLTIQPRQWWEQRFLEHSLRKHPRAQVAMPYSALENEIQAGHATMVFEAIPEAVARDYPIECLKPERDLHTDMLREAGRRSDAHVARYMLAAQFIRPNDRVLDCSSGLGYGAHILWANGRAERVTGLDLSSFAVDYATANYAKEASDPAEPGRICFHQGDAQDLSSIEDDSVDLVVSFETLEHLNDPAAFLKQAKRVLTPGGRLIASVPNDWTDESGEDPNPDHLHVYDWQRLADQINDQFLIECAYSQIAGGGMKLTDRGRSMTRQDVTPDGVGPTSDAEWWLVVGMNDPIGATSSEDADRHFPIVANAKRFNVTAFARDYDNPWLVRSLVSRGIRAQSDELLQSIARRASESARPGSPDHGASLCVRGYLDLNHGSSDQDTSELLQGMARFSKNSDGTPHAIRWQISSEYLAAQLHLKAGRHDQAKRSLKRCVELDPCRFSPLLATKTVAACFELGMMSAGDGDVRAAHRHWRDGIERARQAVSESWLNVIGNTEAPLAFALPELCTLLDSASKCAWAMNGYSTDDDRSGSAWESACEWSPLGRMEWISKLESAKNWYQDQLGNWRRIAIEREQTVRNLSDATSQLQSGKDWLERERDTFCQQSKDHELTISELRSWVDQQEQGKRWIEEQRNDLLAAVGERNQTIEELRAWIEEQEKSKAWLEDTAQRHFATVEEMRGQIEELRVWVEQQEQGKAWLENQNASLMELNEAREAQVNSLKTWITELEKGQASLASQSQHKQEEIERLEKLLRDASAHQEQMQQSLSEVSSELATLRVTHSDIAEAYHTMLNEIQKLPGAPFGLRRRVRALASSSREMLELASHGGHSDDAPHQEVGIFGNQTEESGAEK